MKKLHIATIAAAAVLAGCAGQAPSQGPYAVARLKPTQGSTVEGEVRFTQVGDRVRVTGEIKGLPPGTEHGFHVHEKGDCSSGDGMSAGAHWNPDNQPHGRYDAPRHHSGDLPSLRADAAGNAKFQFESSAFRVGNGTSDVIGKGLIVHRDPDDYTQPAGNSGPRLACAVIVRS